MRTKSLKTLLQDLEEIARAHPAINDFHIGRELDRDRDKLTTYPKLFVQVIDGSYTRATRRWGLSLEVVDQTNNDRSNTYFLVNDTAEILNDVISRLRRIDNSAYILENQSDFAVIYDAMDDRQTGVAVGIDVSYINPESSCDFLGPPPTPPENISVDSTFYTVDSTVITSDQT